MKSKLFKKITLLTLLGFEIFALDKIIPTLINSQLTQKGLENPMINQIMHTKDYFYNYQGSDEEITLSYLKLAHAITMKNITLKDEIKKRSDEELLQKGEGMCEEVSKFTYVNFLTLINQSQKLELKKYVRLVRGSIKEGEKNFPHSWLEFSQKNHWRIYETSTNDLPKSVNINPENIHKLIRSEGVFFQEKDYNPTNYYQINSQGELNRSFNLEGILKSKGFIHEWINRIES